MKNRRIKIMIISCLHFVIMVCALGCNSSSKKELSYELDSYSNFNFLKDLSSDNFKDPELKQVMDFSVELKTLLNAHEYDKAISFLESYLKNNPQDIDSKYQLAYLMYFTEKYVQGLQLARDMLNQKQESFYTKDDPKYELLYAELLIETGSIDEAFLVLKNLVKSNPCSRGYTYLAKIYIKQHKYKAAQYLLKKAKDYHLSFESENSNYVDGFKAFDDSKILDEKSEMYFWMSYLDIYNGRFDEGKANIDEVSSIYRTSPQVLYLYGLYYYSLKQYDQSLKYVSDLNTSYPSFKGYYLESKIFEKKKDQDLQVASLIKSLYFESDCDAKLDLARIYSQDPKNYYEAYVLANQVQQIGTQDQQNQARAIIIKLDNKK